MRVKNCLRIMPVVVLTACALAETPPPTTHPPLTLAPPPELAFAGDCNISSNLADWLLYSTYYVSEFTELVSAAAEKRAGEAYDDVLLMARMRDDYSTVATPDCAEPAQRMIVGTMTRAVQRFQAFVNGESRDLSATLRETLGQFDQVAAIQRDLNSRLESQLSQQQTGG
jgi:hypothetical protein